MPERKGSVDSFDEFFGDEKKNGDRKKSPIKPKQSDTTVATIVKTQPVIKRPRTPERRVSSPPQSKPKVNHTKPSVKTNGYKNPSPVNQNRPESRKSKEYESDFDDENGFDEEETVVESTNGRKEHSSLPPPKQRTFDALRRGSDSELKSSFIIAPKKKSKPDKTRPKEQLFPQIRAQQPRRTLYPTRHTKKAASTSPKNEVEQRVLSAHNNKLKSLESRLAELRRELDAQRTENATLRTIQKREEKAIRNYEEKEYDIHRIMQYYTKQVEHINRVLSTERDTKARLEKQIEARDEKLQDQTKRLKQYEKVVQEKHLDERHDLQEKLNETDKRLQEFEEKLNHQKKYIENLEKNHRHEINQELSKQRDLKRELEARSQKYRELVLKFEDKTRYMDTMHIYAQRGGKRPGDTSGNLSKSHSLQSLHEVSPRIREKTIDFDKKKREQQSKPVRQQSPVNEPSPKQEKKKTVPRKDPPQTLTVNKTSSNVDKSSPAQNNHLPPKGKPSTRRLSTPRSVDEEKNEIDDDTFFGTSPKKLPPPTTIHRGEQHLPPKRPTAPVPPATDSKYKSTGAGGSTTTSSNVKSSESSTLSKPRATRELDEKWSDMFAANKQDNSAKEDLLAKLISDEQQERKVVTTSRPPPAQSSSTNKFDSPTRSTAAAAQPPPPTTTTAAAKPSADPFESLFSNTSTKPTASRTKDPDDIFSTKSSSQPTRQTKTDSFESLFGASSTTNNSSTSNAKPLNSQNDKLQRPKVVTNAAKPIPNRTVIDELEEFVL